jgi:hypothetical protein
VAGWGSPASVAKPTPELVKLQADIIAAAKPFMLKTGPIGSFTVGHDDPAIDAARIDYVSTFEKKAAGSTSIRTSAPGTRRSRI